MRTLGTVAALSAFLLGLAAPARAQGTERVVVLVLDTGGVRLNADILARSIEGTIRRPVVRMTDERAQRAEGRLTIAFSTPNRWVLRYEAQGQVAWVSDRITRPGAVRARLAELSGDLLRRVEVGQVAASDGAHRPGWGDDVVLALQNEIVDPFPRRPQQRAQRTQPVSVLWSEVIDPFRDAPPRAPVTEVWSEVLDPWAAEVRRNR